MHIPGKDFAHMAYADGDGNCSHDQPMCGYCHECRRFDIAQIADLEEWTRPHLPAFTTSMPVNE